MDSLKLALESINKIPVLKNCEKKMPTLMDLYIADLVSSPINVIKKIRIYFKAMLTTLIAREIDELIPFTI